MATTTPNYGWDVPTSTDYVKDGATAIETLGDDIDASLFSITSGKNVGLVHINTATFSAQSAVNVNSVFTSAFDSYLVLVEATASSANQNLSARLRVSGTDASGSNYVRQGFRASSGASTAGFSDTQTSFICGETNTTYRNRWELVFNQPASAVETTLQTRGSNPGYVNILAASHTVTTAYDGFSIFPSGGTITGTVRTYGYRNS